MDISTEFMLILVAPLWLALSIWDYLRPRDALKKWIRENGFEVVDFRVSARSRGRVIYAVRLLDRERREQRGWVRLSNQWLSLNYDIQVKWNEHEKWA
jgi:hypothetical protein